MTSSAFAAAESNTGQAYQGEGKIGFIIDRYHALESRWLYYNVRVIRVRVDYRPSLTVNTPLHRPMHLS